MGKGNQEIQQRALSSRRTTINAKQFVSCEEAAIRAGGCPSQGDLRFYLRPLFSASVTTRSVSGRGERRMLRVECGWVGWKGAEAASDIRINRCVK